MEASMKARIAKSIYLSLVAVSIPGFAHAIEIKTQVPTVHIQVPHTPQVNGRFVTPQPKGVTINQQRRIGPASSTRAVTAPAPSGGTINTNSATGGGGGLSAGSVSLPNSNLGSPATGASSKAKTIEVPSANNSGSGGGIFNSNSATGGGGEIYSGGGISVGVGPSSNSFTLNSNLATRAANLGGIFQTNSATGGASLGGGIFNTNSAPGGASLGGGIFNTNSAPGGANLGGGIFNSNSVTTNPKGTVTSSGSVMFETNLRDERFLPFEGAGAISNWSLTLPSGHGAFAYSTISDVILHIRSTERSSTSSLPAQRAGSEGNNGWGGSISTTFGGFTVTNQGVSTSLGGITTVTNQRGSVSETSGSGPGNLIRPNTNAGVSGTGNLIGPNSGGANSGGGISIGGGPSSNSFTLNSNSATGGVTTPHVSGAAITNTWAPSLNLPRSSNDTTAPGLNLPRSSNDTIAPGLNLPPADDSGTPTVVINNKLEAPPPPRAYDLSNAHIETKNIEALPPPPADNSGTPTVVINNKFRAPPPPLPTK
jgi:hypothetical protein